MKKVLRITGIIIGAVIVKFFTLAGLLFVILSLSLTESYKDFRVEKMDDYQKNEYFSSNELDFARVKDVVIQPEIKEIGFGEYVIYIVAYSKSGLEKVGVKNIRLKEDENVFFNQIIEQNIVFQEAAEELFSGWINAGMFTESDVEVAGRKKFYLTVQVSVEDGTQEAVKEIDYEITVIQYMSVNMR